LISNTWDMNILFNRSDMLIVRKHKWCVLWVRWFTIRQIILRAHYDYLL